MEDKTVSDSFPMLGWLIAEENKVEYRVPDQLSEHSSRIGKYLVIYCPFEKFEHDRFLCRKDDFLIGTDGVLLNSKELLGERNVSDLPEVLLGLGKNDAEGLPALLRGPYCGFLCDRNREKTIVFTNGAGDRPVYYYSSPSERIASSDLNMLIEFCKKNGKKLSIGTPAVFSVLQYGFTVDTFTMVAEIKRVFPGAYLIWDRDGNREHRYHKLDNEEFLLMTEREAIDGLDSLFRQAVKRSFDKDEEYGYRHLADLSGGMDSRMVNWVAHDLGYCNILNICYGLPSCIDYKIASELSTDLGNDFLFFSLSNGRFLLDLDETVWKNFGTAIYCGPTGALTTIKALNTNNIGIRHNGNMGDTIFGAYLTGKTHRPPGNMGGYNYSKRSYDGISTDCSRYQNEEIQKLYARYLLADPASHFLVRDRVIAYSPFMDIDFLDFFLHIPIRYRSGKLYANWVLQKYPQASRYRYNSRVFRITDNRKLAHLFSSGSRRLLDIGQKTLYRWKLSSYEYRMAGMNPIEAIIERSNEVKNYFDNYFMQNLELLDGCPDVKQALKSEYSQGCAAEKALVLTVMSFVKQHDIAFG